jgi:hypothetical protein
MAEAAILPGLAGIVVSDRHQNYFHPRWEHVAGNQACLAHLLRDYQDGTETYPMPPGRSRRSGQLRGLIRGWHATPETRQKVSGRLASDDTTQDWPDIRIYTARKYHDGATTGLVLRMVIGLPIRWTCKVRGCPG